MQRVRTLLSEALVDATLCRHEGRWWLFGASPADRLGQLHIWHAEDLLGEWRPHANNPVRIDPRNSRPAGTPFQHQGILYRRAQNNSRTYGGSIVINRVEVLTTRHFEESAVRELAPRCDSPYPDGLHTLSSLGEWTLLDAKRHALTPGLIGRNAARKWRVLTRKTVAGRDRQPAGPAY